MKITLILFVINLVIVVESDDRTIRHINYHTNAAQVPPCEECKEPEPEPRPELCNCQPRCKKPCKSLPEVKSIALTKVVLQKVTEKLLLTCTPKSFYSSIEFDGSFDLNVSCNAVSKVCRNNVQGIYTGIRTLPNGKKEKHSLNAKTLCKLISFTNGNTVLSTRADLNDCECEGGVLSTSSEWVADDQINCCRARGPGVKETDAVRFELQIYGKCCSQCSLQYGKVWFSKGIKNH